MRDRLAGIGDEGKIIDELRTVADAKEKSSALEQSTPQNRSFEQSEIATVEFDGDAIEALRGSAFLVVETTLRSTPKAYISSSMMGSCRGAAPHARLTEPAHARHPWRVQDATGPALRGSGAGTRLARLSRLAR
ncbi:MAG: hypothetical protein AB7P07_07675 [Hyphomonadaceae bacterium]